MTCRESSCLSSLCLGAWIGFKSLPMAERSSWRVWEENCRTASSFWWACGTWWLCHTLHGRRSLRLPRLTCDFAHGSPQKGLLQILREAEARLCLRCFVIFSLRGRYIIVSVCSRAVRLVLASQFCFKTMKKSKGVVNTEVRKGLCLGEGRRAEALCSGRLCLGIKAATSARLLCSKVEAM